LKPGNFVHKFLKLKGHGYRGPEWLVRSKGAVIRWACGECLEDVIADGYVSSFIAKELV
jgi:hypothetical protein